MQFNPAGEVSLPMKPTTYMLDTDMFSYLVSGRHPHVRAMAAEREKSIVLSSVTLAESLFGARKRGSEKLFSIIGLFRDMFPIVNWTSEAAMAYADIRLSLEQQGIPIGGMDMMIAASALSGGYVLVTNNVRHFGRISGLAIENWLDEVPQGQ